MVVSSVVIVLAGGLAVSLMPKESAEVFLDFLVDYAKWSLGYIVGGSALIKGAGLLKNGKKPEG
jgi:hypothetical protein